YRESKSLNKVHETLFEIDENFIFEDLLFQADNDYVSGELVHVEVRVRGEKTWHFVASGVTCSLRICTKDEQNISHIKFTIIDGKQNIVHNVATKTNAFDHLMNAAKLKALPNPKTGTDQNDNCYNDILMLLHNHNLGWELPPYQQNSFYKNGSHHKIPNLKKNELEQYADNVEEMLLEPWAENLPG
ncbi:3538_t:CDS:2, partial [Cetraspora pellucida]